MKKFFLFLAAVALAMTANAKVTTISPDAENDALRLAVHYAEDGDIIEMTEGTYVQCNNGYVAFDGKSVTVKAAEGANVVLQLQVPITITNGGKANLQGIKIDASRLNDLADWYEHVIYANDATEGKELVMQGCELYGFNINKSAIYSSSSNTLALCDVKDCYFHDNMKSCFFFEGSSIAELSVVNSTFANIATDPASYYAGIVDVRNADAKVTVDHCTFYNCLLMNTDYAAVTMKGPQAANVVISNNIFMLPEAIDGHRAIRNDVEATNCMTFNYVKDNGGIHSSVTKTNCFLNVDPMFVDAANGNFALAEGSPALGAATDGSDLGDPRWNKKADVNDDVVTVPTNAELWEAFKPYYNEYYGLARADQPIDKVSTFAAAKMQEIMTDPESEYKWLGDYVWTIANGQGVTLSTDMAAANEGGWRWAVHAFFNATTGANGAAGTDFTEAGKPENWGPYYLAAKNDTTPEIEWIPMDLEIANLVTEVMEVEGAKYLRLQGRDDMNDADVMLFLNNYADVDDDYEVNAENSYMTFGGLELTVLEGVMTQTSETDKGTIYTGTVRASVEEEGVTMYIEFALTMYAAPATELVITDATVEVNEELGTLTFKTADYFVELSGYTAPGVHEGPQICLLETPDAVAFANYAETSVADGVITLTGEFTSFMGAKFALTVSGKLPKTEPVVKPEPTYTENKLNTYAFGLESELNDSALVVTYRLNNSNATSVNVIVYKGENVVATVAGTTTIGVNTVAIPVANLPKGRMLTWSVEVNGTSVEVPTQESKIYSFYHPSGVDVDNNPENPTFGMLLINEGMQSVVSKTDGYVSAQFGAGIFAFTPSLDLIPNGDKPGYNGGITFTTTRADGTGTAYSPRRIRISEDGRIFVTSLNTDGNYLWEVNPDNLDEWTTVFQGTLNDNKELIDADSNFVAAPNNGFDVKGAGENLQLAMYSVNLPGITAAAMSGFRLHEYNLGTATTWATAPSKTIVDGLYAINYTGTQVEYDNEGGVWIASYRGTANDANPGLVHINADGVEDAKLIWSNVRQAGIRFNNDFTKLVVAGNNGAAKKATIYAVSKDANGAPVLTEETVIDMAAVGNNLNDFAFDYAGNLYACGNSAEKLIGWAMPYSGQVVTPAASKYAFHIGELLPDPAVVTEMVGVVKRAVQNGESTIVLTHETDGTPHIYEVTDGTILELLQNGVIARDPENAGDYLAISDIAVTEDGKLVATNYMQTQSGDDYVDAGLKRGETRIYIWNDLHDAPSILFTSKMSSNWFRSKQGLTMAVKGTSDNMEIFMTGIHATKAWARASSYRVIDGVYVEPDVNHNDHYFFYDINDAIALETTVGTEYELSASPLGEMNWILDANLINPVEIVESSSNNQEIATSVALTEDLGKKYNGASYVTVGEKVLMVAPYATPEGKLTGVEILDITGGLDAAQYVDQLFIDEAVEATAAATAVEVVEGDEATALLITLVADATIYSLEATLSNGPDVQIYEDEITNLVIDLDNLVLMGGPSSAFQVDVYLPLGEYNMSEDSYQLTAESSIAVMGSDATFIEGYAYEVDAFTPSAKAVVRCEWNGMLLEFHLTMTAEPMEATVVVVENAVVEIEKYLLWGDMYDYALTMSGEWVNPADGLTYPVLVEVPVYYPEATEPSEIMSTVTVGGWDDNDPWLGFGEGTLTVTTENISDGQKLITAKGIVQNPMAGVAIDITISGKLIPSALENVETTVAPVKVIKNGQLIIIKNGVEYNVQGAVIK